jgi:ATP-binding cassette subfamily G (WHITE) protein 2 (SNQ2)
VTYYGPRQEAKGYFENMGFVCQDGANVADFLTGVTVASERVIHDEVDEASLPLSAASFAKAYSESELAKRMLREVDDYVNDKQAREQETARFREVVAASKEKGTIKKEAYVTNFGEQLIAALKREFQVRWADKATLICRTTTTFIVSFILGSLYYQMPQDTNGIFIR